MASFFDVTNKLQIKKKKKRFEKESLTKDSCRLKILFFSHLVAEKFMRLLGVFLMGAFLI